MQTKSWAPRGLRAPDAAAYVGIGRSKFFELVEEGRLPKPVKIDGCVVWDRFALDAAFDAFNDTQIKSNPWDELCG
jgi:predicted DNA-binding transcriptional regulator AlpA